MLKYQGIIFVMLVWVSTPTHSQDRETVDSLMNELKGKTGGERFWPLYGLAFQFMEHNNQKALELIKEAKEAALLSGDSLKIIKAMRVQGTIFSSLQKPDKALASIQPVLKIPNLKNFSDEYLMVMHLAGSCYSLMGRFDDALDSHFMLLEEAKKRKDAQFIFLSTKNIGFVYYKLKDYKKAIHFMKKSLDLNHLSQVPFQNPLNLSLSYTHLKSYDSARIFLNESASVCGSQCPAEARTHLAYASGCIFYGLGRLEDAKLEFLKSLSFARQVGDARMQLDNIYLLAKIYIQKKELPLAEEYLRAGEQVINSGIPFNMEAMKVYEQLAELYLATRDYEKAVLFQSLYIKLKDSLYNEAVTNRLIEIESEHLEIKNKSTIAEQQKAINEKQELIRRQEKLNILSALVLLLTVSFVFFLFRNYRKKQVLNALLDRKVQERTMELEVSRRELLREIRMREILISRAASHIHERINTMKGLCVAAREELTDPSALEYVEKMSITSNNIQGYLKSIQKAPTQKR